MVYQAHIAGGLALLALVAGTWMLVRVCHQEICCRWFAKAVGIFVITLSLLMLACNAYHSYRFWKTGADKVPGMGMHWPRATTGMGPARAQQPQPPRPPMQQPAMTPPQGMGPGMMQGPMSMERPAQGAAQAAGTGCPMRKGMEEQGKAAPTQKSVKPEKLQAK